MKREDLVKMIVANKSTNQWLITTEDVEGTQIYVRAFGKWVQVMTNLKTGRQTNSVMGIKTVKGFKEAVEKCLKEVL